MTPFEERFGASFPRGLTINSLRPGQFPPLQRISPMDKEAWLRAADPTGGVAVAPPMQPPAPPPVVAPVAALPTAAPLVAAPPVVAPPAWEPDPKQAIVAPPVGLTLTSAPGSPQPAQNWAGSIGLPGSPEEAKAFDKGQKYNELMAGLEDIKKGLQPKVDSKVAAEQATITPMGLQPNMANKAASDLMTQLLASKRQRRGLSLVNSEY